MNVYSDEFRAAAADEARRLAVVAHDIADRVEQLLAIAGDVVTPAPAPPAVDDDAAEGRSIAELDALAAEHGGADRIPAHALGDPARCGAMMVGSGTDAYDPTCDLEAGHDGACKSYAAVDQHRLERPGEQKASPGGRPGEVKDAPAPDAPRPGEQKDGPASPPPTQTPQRADGSAMRPQQVAAEQRRQDILAWVETQWDVNAHDVAQQFGIDSNKASADLRELAGRSAIIRTDEKRRGRAQTAGATGPVYHALVRPRSHPDSPNRPDGAAADGDDPAAPAVKVTSARLAPERVRDAIVELSDRGRKEFTRRQLATMLVVSQEAARDVLHGLRDAGKVEQVEERGGTTVWRYLRPTDPGAKAGDGPARRDVADAALDAAGVDASERPTGRGGIEGTGANGLLRGASETVKRLVADCERLGGVVEPAPNGHIVIIGPRGRAQVAKTPGTGGALTQTRKHVKRMTGLEVPVR